MSPMIPPYAHRHACVTCDNWMACHQHPDRCAVPDPYQCPNCERQELDAHMNNLAAGAYADVHIPDSATEEF